MKKGSEVPANPLLFYAPTASITAQTPTNPLLFYAPTACITARTPELLQRG